jgi:Zn-dependent protease
MSTNRPTISVKGRRGKRLALSWRAASAPRPLPPLFAPEFPRSARVRTSWDGCIQLFRVAGIPVRFHWSTLLTLTGLFAASGSLGLGPALLALTLCAVSLVHELGHAAAARRFGCEVFDIRIFALFGRCRYDEPYSNYEAAVIAWGGVAAQLLLLLPAVAVFAWVGNTTHGAINVVLIGFTYVNTVVMLCNLVPARGMDGAKAWRLPAMLVRAKWTMRQLRRSKVLL